MDIEQTIEQSTETAGPETGEPASRDELMAAVREAGGTESVDVDAEAAKAGTPPPAKDAPPATAEDEPPILAKLREREESWKKTQDAESRAERLIREAQEKAERIQAEAREKARLEHEQWLAEQRRKFETSPTDHLRALGDPDKIADLVMQDGTPEARARRELEMRIAKAEEKAEVGEQARKELEAWKQEQARIAREELQAKVQTEYLSQFASKEKAPYLHARYEPEEIFQKSVALAHEWAQKGLQYKKDFDDSTVAEYLESQAKKRLASLGLAPQAVAGATQSNGSGSRPHGLANGSRTLSAAAGSERRTSPKPVSEMTPDEERQALIDAVREAKRTIKD
jgi:hypothetical protein